MKSSNKNEKIQLKIENFCLYQDRCKKEVITKLKSLGVETKMIEKIVLNLLNQDLLNEIRYSKNYSRGKFRIKKWGRLKIYQELKKRNISEFNIKIGLKEIEENYVSACEELVKKIWHSNESRSLIEKKKKIWDYLRYRGWEKSLIFDQIEKQLIYKE
tara:strand:+ start:110 stop:583 length:474 start_codon:yes stop_codon:yes gene_type:complete